MKQNQKCTGCGSIRVPVKGEDYFRNEIEMLGCINPKCKLCCAEDSILK